MDRALSLLALSRKGGNIELGEEQVAAVCRAKKARLIVLAEDAADHTFRRVKGFVAGSNQPWIRIPYTKEDLGDALGRNVCAMAAITDVRLALAFVNALGNPDRHAALIADLTERVARVDKRQKEEKAHKRNIQMGKKKR